MTDIEMKKEPKGTLSIICGVITVGCGAAACFTAKSQTAGFFCLLITILLNLLLHIDSYISNKRIGKVQSGVLIISVVEVCFIALLLWVLVLLPGQGFGERWMPLMVAFSSYLVINGACLMALPLGFARICGVSAILTGILVFITADSYGFWPAICLGLSLVVNGGERVVMSLMARAAKKKRVTVRVI